MSHFVAETGVFYKIKSYIAYLADLGVFKDTCLYVIGLFVIHKCRNFLVVAREDAPFATSAFVVTKRLKSTHSTRKLFKTARLIVIIPSSSIKFT